MLNGPRVLLGIGLLQQSAPEFVVVLRVTVDELPIDCRQPVIDHHIHPLSEHPELKVEDSSVAFRVFWIPFLFLIVWNYLESNKHTRNAKDESLSVEAVRLSEQRVTDYCHISAFILFILCVLLNAVSVNFTHPVKGFTYFHKISVAVFP